MGRIAMHRISIMVVAVAVAAVLSTESYAQGGPNAGQCEQVRAAIAQHGLQAARKHAMENYGLSLADIRRIEQECGIDNRGRRTNR
jgi:ribosomal protein S9